MSITNEQIKEQLGEFAAKFGPKTILAATVTAINTNETIQIEFPDGGIIEDCRLTSVIMGGSKFIITPAKGSIILVGRIENSDEFFAISFSSIIEVKHIINTSIFKQTKDVFQFLKDNDSLLEVFELLIESVMQIVIVQGTNPDRVKLQKALVKVKNILQSGT